MNSELFFSGKLTARKLSGKAPPAWKLKNNLRWAYISGWLGKVLGKPLRRLTGLTTLQGELSIVKIFANGHRMNYGVVSRHLVTDAFVAFMVDQLQAETSTWGDFKYHDSGVGVTAADNNDTDIETTDGESRATGSQIEGASAWIYKSVGTISYTSTKAITEHLLANASTAGTAMDHHVFAALNVVSGDSIEFTYQLTCTAET